MGPTECRRCCKRSDCSGASGHFYDGLGGAPFDTTQLAWDFLKGASMSPPPINDCPVGCVSVNARQRRQLLFGQLLIIAKCPKGCVAA